MSVAGSLDKVKRAQAVEDRSSELPADSGVDERTAE